jgi:hypothetical protein
VSLRNNQTVTTTRVYTRTPGAVSQNGGAIQRGSNVKIVNNVNKYTPRRVVTVNNPTNSNRVINTGLYKKITRHTQPSSNNTTTYQHIKQSMRNSNLTTSDANTQGIVFESFADKNNLLKSRYEPMVNSVSGTNENGSRLAF